MSIEKTKKRCHCFNQTAKAKVTLWHMAKNKIQKIIEHPSPATEFRLTDSKDFDEIVRQTLIAQEASLKAMQLLVKSIIGERD